MLLNPANSQATTAGVEGKSPSRRYGAPVAARTRTAKQYPPAHQPVQTLRYRFAQNQSFAYAVHIQWTTSAPGLSGRLTGCPYFVVNYVDEHDAVLMVLGRLRFEKITGEGKAQKMPSKDYWLGTTAILDLTEGKKSGRMGPKGYDCPVSPTHIVSELIFPELPHHVGDETRSGGSISVTRGTIGPGAPPLTHTSGNQTFTTRATSLGGSRVQLLVEKRFDPDGGGAASINRSVATFDHRLGAIIDHNANHTRKKGGVTYAITMTVRRVASGQAFEGAKKSALEDAKNMPKKMAPLELMRRRLNLRLPKRYGPDDLPAPGTVVGYYDSEFPVHDDWYAAKFLRKIDRDKAVIRYLGSNEEETVRPGGMAKLGR